MKAAGMTARVSIDALSCHPALLNRSADAHDSGLRRPVPVHGSREVFELGVDDVVRHLFVRGHIFRDGEAHGALRRPLIRSLSRLVPDICPRDAAGCGGMRQAVPKSRHRCHTHPQVDSFASGGVESLDDINGQLCIESEYMIVQKFANVRKGEKDAPCFWL